MMHPQRIASLWDMLSAIGEGISAISNVVHMLGQVGDAVKKIEPNDSIQLTEEYLAVAIRDLNCLKSIADDLNLDAASHSVDYCLTVLSRGYVHGDGSYTLPFNNAERLVTALDAIRINFLVQMRSRLVLVIESKHSRYLVSDDPPFGSAVIDAFPNAAAEISEAAKCLAFHRWTAVVFHLMRAMEVAVQKLAQTAGVEKIQGVAWGVILSPLENQIKKMPAGELRNAWSQSHSHLYHVKQAWRNDTMHPKTTYTEEEASAVFDAVKSFMIHLAPLIASQDQA